MRELIRIFIDTNVYLSFYHFTSDDLEELKKLVAAIESLQIELYTTSQVIEEFKRNRENKIKDALRKFGEQKFEKQFPKIFQAYAEFQELQKARREYEQSKGKILQKLQEDVENEALPADVLIQQLFSKSTLLESDKRIYLSARRRVELGNPPGKKGSLGDAFNWEILLTKVPKVDIYFVTEDTDYVSPLNEERPAQYLLEEWHTSKGTQLFLYRKLSNFFQDIFPQIKLASEIEKQQAISNLANSSNFDETHRAIRRLSKFIGDFTDHDINDILIASITNDQIYWISTDYDVRQFFDEITSGKEQVVDPEVWKKYRELFSDEAQENSQEAEQ